jgi:hypothetical protein
LLHLSRGSCILMVENASPVKTAPALIGIVDSPSV